MKNYEKLPLPRITEKEYHLLSYIIGAEGFNEDSVSDIIRNILRTHTEKEVAE